MTSEYGTAHRQWYRTANKSHVCCECAVTIKRREVYHVLTGIWEDGPATFKTCLPCRNLRAWMTADAVRRDAEDWPSIGDLPQCVAEWLDWGHVFPEEHREYAHSIAAAHQSRIAASNVAHADEAIQNGGGDSAGS